MEAEKEREQKRIEAMDHLGLSSESLDDYLEALGAVATNGAVQFDFDEEYEKHCVLNGD